MRFRVPAFLLLLAMSSASAADICPVARQQQPAADPASRIAAITCNEHVLWYRPFIDRDGRLASSTVMESEARPLADGESQVWRRVARYWQESGLLRQMGDVAGAGECGHANSNHHPSPGCRAFIVDNPWSAVFVSWVMSQARLPGFRGSASHIDYVRRAHLHPEISAYQWHDPASAKPAAGDLLCYVRGTGSAYGYAGLLAAVRADGGGLNMHCEIVVAASPDNDGIAYLIGGNMQQGVTMRLLSLNRNGEFWDLPQRIDGGLACSPDNAGACSFNRHDWAVLLKLKPPELLAQLPSAAGPVPIEPPPPPACCIHCVVGSGVPRCPPSARPERPSGAVPVAWSGLHHDTGCDSGFAALLLRASPRGTGLPSAACNSQTADGDREGLEQGCLRPRGS